MIIPIFIAILLGLVNPYTHTSKCNSGTVTVNTTSGDPNDPGDPDDPNNPGNGGTGNPGTGGSGDDGTGGENTQLPPKP